MVHSEQICATLLTALGVPIEGSADLDVVSLPVGVPDTDLFQSLSRLHSQYVKFSYMIQQTIY